MRWRGPTDGRPGRRMPPNNEHLVFGAPPTGMTNEFEPATVLPASFVFYAERDGADGSVTRCRAGDIPDQRSQFDVVEDGRRASCGATAVLAAYSFHLRGAVQ